MEKQFVNGLIVKAPRDNAPDFVKGSISIKIKDLGMWLKDEYKKGEEWINLDIKEGKSGKWYAEVNTWKPEKKTEQPQFSDDIPF